MYSAIIIYGLGIVVSILDVFLWGRIVLSQTRQFNSIKTNDLIKSLLLVFGIASLLSNITPTWFDIYRLLYPQTAHPSNISYAYITGQYFYRTMTAIMFYVIYKS